MEPGAESVFGRLLADVLVVLDRYQNYLPLGPGTVTYQLCPTWVPGHYEARRGAAGQGAELRPRSWATRGYEIKRRRRTL